MVKNNKNYINTFLLINEVNDLLMSKPPSNEFFISQLDFKTIKLYYELKRKMVVTFKQTDGVYSVVKKLPSNVWILKKYLFESLFFITAFILFIFYLVHIPVFRGMVSLFVALVFLVYFFLRNWTFNKSISLGAVIYEILQKINIGKN